MQQGPRVCHRSLTLICNKGIITRNVSKQHDAASERVAVAPFLSSGSFDLCHNALGDGTGSILSSRRPMGTNRGASSKAFPSLISFQNSSALAGHLKSGSAIDSSWRTPRSWLWKHTELPADNLQKGGMDEHLTRLHGLPTPLFPRADYPYTPDKP